MNPLLMEGFLESDLSTYVFIGIFIAVLLGVVCACIPVYHRRQWGLLFGLAARRRWTLLYPDTTPKLKLFLGSGPLKLSGRERNRRVRVMEHYVGSGKHRQTWLRFEVEAERDLEGLRVERRNWLSLQLEKLGWEGKKLKTGDAAFDAKFRLYANKPMLATAMLPELRRDLVAAWPERGGANITTEGNRVQFSLRGALSQANLDKVEKMIPVVFDLADYLETFGEATLWSTNNEQQ